MSESIKNQKSEAYEQFITTTPQDVLERSVAYTTFLGDEFSKEGIMTSALFSELVLLNIELEPLRIKLFTH